MGYPADCDIDTRLEGFPLRCVNDVDFAGYPVKVNNRLRYFTKLTAASTQYFSIPTITLIGDFEIEFSVTLTATADRSIFGSTNFTTTGFDGNTLIYVDDPDGLEFVVGKADTTFDRYIFGGNAVLRDGKLNTASIKRVGDQASARVNGAALGPLTVVTKDIVLEGLLGGGDGRYVEGFLADVKIWTGGDRNTGVLTRHYRINEDGSTSAVVDHASGEDGTRINMTSADSELFIRQANGNWLATDGSPLIEV